MIAKAKRELLEQKLQRLDKHEGIVVHSSSALIHKQSLSEEKFQRALAAYNGRRELEKQDEQSEVFNFFINITFLLYFFGSNPFYSFHYIGRKITNRKCKSRWWTS